ncbi:MAG: L-histidine N(alpha)-methyltransferase [Kofleriaceae bacterium]|nr:MAG: L-histidine N(alpha)-methyltransferase [Kofleriaceae bacterium]MBZ0237664.1 L-histidine N(alpha)-methyltransferase [Kofleriaceae bacterium]
MTVHAYQRDLVRDEVLRGLSAPRKHLPCRLLYDARGAELFEQICTLEEYYPTRTELALLEEHLPALAAAIGPQARVVEPGSGAGQKTRMLLTALDRPVGYVPIDISREQLEVNARALREEFPGLEVQPICGDYTSPLELPRPTRPGARTVAFFPGSTIGNFEPDEARAFLARLAHLAGRDGMLLLGADANNDRASLERAYDDGQGVTAAFDKNVLAHVNRTHDATFELDAFTHRAVWDASHHRVEMHLVSMRTQTVRVGADVIRFERGEPIVTEHCYKHPREAMAAMLADAGWRALRVDADARGRMHLWLAGC